VAADRVGTAVVLGGGGVLGAVQVGMLRGLLEAGVRPDLVLGTSVGAINGAVLAAVPAEEVADRLEALWRSPEAAEVFAAGAVARLRELARSRTAAHSPAPLRRALVAQLGDRRIEDLPVPFGCCAACIEDAAEHWFDRGPLLTAVLASAAVPGLLPPVAVDGRHYLDGGLVNSIPLGRAVELGATTVFVLQVGRVEQPLHPPRRPWEVAAVAFEIARRHRFARDLGAVPPGVVVHVLPAGEGAAPRWDSREALRYRDTTAIDRRIAAAHLASADYLRTAVGRAG
jgi:NTE family protein